MKPVFTAIFCVLLSVFAFSQNTNISGVINTYRSVSAIQGNTITVTSTNGIAADDLLLIIQMQGATINETNTSSFGNIDNYNNAGNFEYIRVCQVLSANQILTTQIQQNYSIIGKVQLITVPEYTEATVTGALTADPWDGTTGGVLAFECSNKVILNANIDVQGLGFRGGDVNTSSFNCSWLVNNDDYFYELTTGRGAQKGEGIANYIVGKTAGRGKNANGGGGGNDHNSGGGGGSNGSAGGNGGERIGANGFSCSGPNPGRGGGALSFATDRMFMGGGGGAGHENNANTSTAGLNGGGIIIIRSDTIVGNGNSILASGQVSAANSEDGAGGGGAGGAVFLDANHYSTTVNVTSNGSNGGNVLNVGTSNCNGPGGGGSGGVFLYSNSVLPPNTNVSVSGGGAGTTVGATQSGCSVGGSNNATGGATGIILGNRNVIEPSNANFMVQNELMVCANDSIFFNGNWQTMPEVFYDTIAGSCIDTITETTLSFYPESIDTLNTTICQGDSLIVNGTTYNSAITGATEIFIGASQNGCDSTVIINIDLLPVANSIDAQTSCEPLVWIDGNTYDTTNNVAAFVIPNGSALGCDSTVTLNFTKQELNRSLTQNGFSLSSNANGATYQWFDCSNGFVPLAGETNQTFNATQNSFYAVEITQNGCTDTSNCVEIKGLTVQESDNFNNIKVYPNPATNFVTIELGDIENVEVNINSMDGKLIYQQKNITQQTITVNLEASPGIYILEAIKNNQSKQFKLSVSH